MAMDTEAQCPPHVRLRWANTVAAASARFVLPQTWQYNVEVQNKMKKVWVGRRTPPDNAKRSKALRDASDDIKRWTNKHETLRHHILDGTVTFEGRTVLQVRNSKLTPSPADWLFDDLKNKLGTPVAVPLSR